MSNMKNGEVNNMEDIIYEKDYRNKPETEEDKRHSAIFEQAVKGGFFKTYKEEMDKIPKVIVPKDKIRIEGATLSKKTPMLTDYICYEVNSDTQEFVLFGGKK